MIILNDRNDTKEKDIVLENKEQIQSSQTWIFDYPAGLSTRCHYYYGDFRVDGLSEMAFGPIGYALRSANNFFGEKVNIKKLWEDKIRGKNFSEEEWNCLLKDGFLGILKMRCPELKDSKAFNFCYQVDQKVKELEQKNLEEPFSEILKEIENHVVDETSDEHKLWEVLKAMYTIPMVLGERSLCRESYIDFLRQQQTEKSSNDSKKTAKSRTEGQKIDDDLEQWLGGRAPEVEGSAEGYSINKYGEIEKKDPDLEELESLRDKKQQLLEEQKKIAEAEKLVDAMENQGPNLDE